MGQRPSPYDRPVMSRGGFFGPGPGRGGAALDQMRSGSSYSGGMYSIRIGLKRERSELRCETSVCNITNPSSTSILSSSKI